MRQVFLTAAAVMAFMIFPHISLHADAISISQSGTENVVGDNPDNRVAAQTQIVVLAAVVIEKHRRTVSHRKS